MWLKSILTLIVVLLCGIGGYIYSESRPVEKKYVAIYEPALWDSENLSDVEKDLYLSASVWIREYLLAHPNVSVLETSVAEKPGISIEDFFKRTAADEVVATDVDCIDSNCNLSVRVIGENGFILKNEINNRVVAGNTEIIQDIVLVSMSKFYNLTVKSKNSDNLNVDYFDEFLRLYQGYLFGTLETKVLLKGLRDFQRKEPGFIGVYRVWIQVLLDKYYDTLDKSYLSEIQTVIEFEESETNHHQVLIHKLHLLLITGKKEEVFGQIEKLRTEFGFSEEVISAYAYFYSYTSDHERADEYYQKLVRLRPSVENYYNASINAWWSSELEKMEFYLRELLKIIPNHIEGNKLLAASSLIQGDLTRAQVAYEKLLFIKEDSAIRNNLGLVYFLLKKYGEARNQFKLALSDSPGKINLLLNLAETELLLKMTGSAVKNFELVVAKTNFSTESKLLASRAQALAHLGKFNEAITIIRSLEKKHPNNNEIQYAAAIIYSLAGDKYSSLVSANSAMENGLGPVWLNIPWLKGLCVTDSNTEKEVVFESNSTRCENSFSLEN